FRSGEPWRCCGATERSSRLLGEERLIQFDLRRMSRPCIDRASAAVVYAGVIVARLTKEGVTGRVESAEPPSQIRTCRFPVSGSSREWSRSQPRRAPDMNDTWRR